MVNSVQEAALALTMLRDFTPRLAVTGGFPGFDAAKQNQHQSAGQILRDGCWTQGSMTRASDAPPQGHFTSIRRVRPVIWWLHIGGIAPPCTPNGNRTPTATGMPWRARPRFACMAAKGTGLPGVALEKYLNNQSQTNH